jgi:succinoglycan biosynthesis transport protein ExoP
MNRLFIPAGPEEGAATAIVRYDGADVSVARPEPILSRYLKIANRRKWLILGIIAACLIVGMIVTLLTTPLYSATTTIEIKREGLDIVNVEGVDPEPNSVDMEFYQTQYGLLKARSLAERVARDLRLHDNAAFFSTMGVTAFEEQFENGRPSRAAAASQQARLDTAAGILLQNLSVAPVPFSRLVEIQFTSPDPVLSAQIANAWAAHFIQSTLARRFEATSYARSFLEQRLQQLRQRLEDSERQAVAYAARQGIVSVPSTISSESGAQTTERPLAAEDLSALNQELARATADRVRAQSRLRSAGANVSEALENPAIGSLRQRRAELAAQHASMMVNFETGYPPAMALAAQIRELDSLIQREVGRVTSSLQNNYQASAEREAALQQRVRGAQAELLDLRSRSIQYNIFQRDVDTNRQLYDGLLQRYKEIGIAGGVGVNNISIVDTADVPGSPSSPRMLVNLFISLLAGLGIGVGLALVLEHLDEALKDPSDVKDKLQISLLGAVPKIAGDDPVQALEDPKSDITEAYLSVQTSLAFATDHGAPRTLVVTSSRPGEGKSTTSYALAKSLARSGKRVLLVDGDMRNPSVHKQLGLKNGQGLSNYLAGQDDWRAMLQPLSTPGLSALSAGPPPPNAAELLTSPRLENLLQELRESFDHIIIDGPPIMGLADAPLLASQVEGAIFVLESHSTKAGLAKVALSRLANARARVLGAVVTKFDARRTAYGYGYAYEYSYGDKSRAPA